MTCNSHSWLYRIDETVCDAHHKQPPISIPHLIAPARRLIRYPKRFSLPLDTPRNLL
jgi:hypothetical protein